MRRYPKNSDNRRSFLITCILIIVLIILSVIVNISLRPIIFDMAEQAGKYAVYETINDTVAQLFSDREIDYSGFVKLVYNDGGYVSAVEYNYNAVNRLKMECSESLIHNLSELKSSKVKVPIGSIFGDINGQGRGPKLKFKISQASVPDVDIVSVFEACGINQTKHEIRLIIGASAQIYIPPEMASFSCKQEYILASTIIVGNIPEGYAVIN